MALAVLFAKTRRSLQKIPMGDIVATQGWSLVVDHKLRPNSREEAFNVMRELRKIDPRILKPVYLAIQWNQELRSNADPTTLPNIESVARRARYRKLGNACKHGKLNRILTAHHSDDQYETVLMRLLAGHGSRGLRGMKPEIDIPECYDEHGIYQSGFIDDQMLVDPLWNFRPSKQSARALRGYLRDEVNELLLAEGMKDDLGQEEDDNFPFYAPGVAVRDQAPELVPLDSEDGGIIVYRPLLEFDKARLMATCEAYNVKWFEDHTNHDPTLTARNAIRYMRKNFQLPEALQKSAILRLAARCDARSKAEDQEAERLAAKAVIQDFETNIGTMVVKLPDLKVRHRRRRLLNSAERHQLRLTHLRTVAALLARKLMGFVTPERHLPPIANLQTVVSRLFPSLAHKSDLPLSSPPKSFNTASVLFVPLQGESAPLSWYLTRTPYASNQPLPSVLIRTFPRSARKHGKEAREFYKRPWIRHELFDGRFWVAVRARTLRRIRVGPFDKAYAKEFREALPPEERSRLAGLLKRYAPGKVRYTLPAIYEEFGFNPKEPNYDVRRMRLKLLALPSLSVTLPGLEKWLQYDIRYRKVDIGVLSTANPSHATMAPRPRERTTFAYAES
jgi:tRNA(Ile)-lysidine synthase